MNEFDRLGAKADTPTVAEHLAADVEALDAASSLPRPYIINEAGSWWVGLDGVAVHGDAKTLHSALNDMVTALREYASDWTERLHSAPNHRQHAALVAFVTATDDAKLREWLESV